MCGICGELHFGGAAPDLTMLQRMSDKLVHRGPDSGKSWHYGPIAFAHRRLAVIDLSEQSTQPMLDKALQLVIVFNGTVYNYRELRQTLQRDNYEFKSHGDTEVILKAYHKWGESCVEKLQGMFAFAIWDLTKQRLFLARDRLGLKPLYFSKTKHHFRFASNTQALLADAQINKDIDTIALHHHLTLHAVTPAPRTILKSIRKLAPATTMTIHLDGSTKVQQYWNLSAQRPADPLTDTEWIDRIHATLSRTVLSHQNVADVPVGILLSGGLDSSLLVALLAESGMHDILTFSIGFEDIANEKGCEFEYSDQVAEYYQTKHKKILIPNASVLEHLPNAVGHMAEPMVSQDAVAFYILAEQVSKEIKVVQSGQGADELFAGYFWFPRMQQDTSSNLLMRFAQHYFDRTHDEYLETVTKPYQGKDYTSLFILDQLTQPGADSFIDEVLRLDITTLVVDDPVKRVDNMTMAWGLEARVPFLDHHLVEIAASMPPHLKLNSNGKHALKVIANHLLPHTIIDRPKGYFPMPALKIIRGEFLTFMSDILNSTACRQRGLFQRTYVNQLLAQPEQHFTPLQGSKLWHLTLLEYWLQQHVDNL